MNNNSLTILRLKKTPLITYSFIQLIFFFGDGLIDLTLPLFFLQMGLSYSQIGLLLSSFGLGMVVFNLFLGAYSDNIGRKFYIVFSLFFHSLLFISFLFARNVTAYSIILLLKGFARSAFMVVRAPFIKEISSVDQRGKAIGFISAASTVGLTISGLFAGFFSYNRIFIFIAFLYFIAGLISIFFLPDRVIQSASKQYDNHQKISRKININQILNNIIKVPNTIWLLCLVNFIQSLIFSQLWSMVLPIYLTSIVGLSVASMGYVYSIDNFLGIPASIFGGYLSDKYNSKKNCSLLMGIISLLGFSFLFTYPKYIFIIILLLFMTLFSIVSPILERIESINARNELSGFDLSLILTSNSVGGMCSQIVIGCFMEQFGESSGFIAVGVGYLFLSGLIKFGMPWTGGKE